MLFFIKQSPHFTENVFCFIFCRFLSPERAMSPAIPTDTCQEEFISPKTLANQVCKELEKHRARGITSIQDILSVVFYYEGPHLRTFGPRHRQAGENPPAEAGLSALAIAINMAPEKQNEFLHILQEKSESDILSKSPSSPVTSSTAGGVSTDPDNVKELLTFVKSMLQRSESILKAPLEESPDQQDSTVRGEFERQVESHPPQEVVDTVVRQQEREQLKISVKDRRSSSPKAVVPEYDQSVLDHLTSCNKNIKMPLSKSMQSIADMEGMDLVNFFHEKVADISTDVEMLDHIVWCGVMSFLIPFKEVMSCVMLSDKGIYVMSDEPLNVSSPSPTAFGHRRMRSDPTISRITSREDHSGIFGFNKDRSDKRQGINAGGVLHCPRESSPKKRIKCQTMIKLTDLEEVIMGLFDQKLRLTGKSSDSTITLMICNVLQTQEFKEHLMSVLPVPKSSTPHPVEKSTSGIDFYKPQRHRAETSEYIHPSKVKFCYPNDETIGDLTYLIVINIKGKKATVDETNILLYMPVYQIIGNGDMKGSITIREPIEQNEKCQRTLVITNGHLTLLKEDHVSYPLPSFSKMLPDNPQYDVQEIQSIESLRRLVVSDFSSHDVSLVFELMEVNVDISRDYYSASTDGHERKSPISPEVSWPLVLASFEDRERLIKLLKGQWMESTGEELSIQVST